MRPNHPSVGTTSTRRLLLRLAAAMVAGGMPVYEVEEEIDRVGAVLGYRQVQCSATPTGIQLSLASGEPAAFERVRGALRLDQLTQVNDIRRDLVAGKIGTGRALAALAALPGSAPRYPRWARIVGVMGIGAGICAILQPGVSNVIVAALAGLLVAGLIQLAQKVPSLSALLPTAAAFVVSVAIFIAAQQGILVGPLRTLICPIAVLLPGGTLATAFAELAAASMIAGASRLTYGTIQMLLFALGIALATAVTGTDWTSLNNVKLSSPLGPLSVVFGLVMISIGMSLSESMPARLIPWSFGLLTLTYVAQIGAQALGGAVFGTFIGAAVASFFSAFIALVSPRVPRAVIFLPAFWLLVPGTLGLLSLTQLSNGSQGARTVLVSVVGLTVALSLGLLVGSAAARPLPRVARRVNRRRRVAEDAEQAQHPSTTPEAPEVDVEPILPNEVPDLSSKGAGEADTVPPGR